MTGKTKNVSAIPINLRVYSPHGKTTCFGLLRLNTIFLTICPFEKFQFVIKFLSRLFSPVIQNSFHFYYLYSYLLSLFTKSLEQNTARKGNGHHISQRVAWNGTFCKELSNSRIEQQIQFSYLHLQNVFYTWLLAILLSDPLKTSFTDARINFC